VLAKEVSPLDGAYAFFISSPTDFCAVIRVDIGIWL
jgi:hypothetical protein